MQTVFSQRLLAGLRTLRDNDEVRDADSDDVIDPDDSGPRLSVSLKEPVGKTYPATGPAAQAEQTSAEQTSGRFPVLAINPKRHNRRQALLLGPICSIPWYSVRCRPELSVLSCTSRPPMASALG